MRIPFPERVPIDRVAIFAIALAAIQFLEGTPPYFSVGCVAFILIAAFAFNEAGGLSRASGAYVFFYSTLVVIVGICYKAFLGEPAQTNLLDPETDILVYVGGISAMYVAVFVSRRFRRKTALLQHLLKDSTMYRASVGCILFGVTGGFVVTLLGPRAGSAFAQLNLLMPLGIIIGTVYEIRRTGGTQSANITTILAGAYFFIIYGILGYSKQGMLLPIICWLLPVCALRFRLSALQVIGGAFGLFIVFHFLVPYSQYGRRFLSPSASLDQEIETSVRLLSNPDETRKHYEEEALGASYFNTPQGFWDRLQFVSVDDSLINITDQGRVFGLSPIPATLLNAVPHVLWPDKPALNFGNLYAHEIGGMPDEDTSTGISFSPTAEAYHMQKWVGVLVVAPLLWFMLFLIFDSLFGDLRTTPWGLLVLAQISHAAPEQALTGVIYLFTFGTVIFTFCAFFSSKLAPSLASIVLGAERKLTRPPTQFRSAPTLPPSL